MPRTKATVKRRQQRSRLEREAEKALPQEAQLQQQVEQDGCEEAPQSTGNQDAGVEEDQAPPANVEDAFVNGGEDRSRENEKENEEEEEEEEVEEDKATENDGEEGQLLLTAYEKEREKRIKENAAKLASLNLPSLASSLGVSRRPQRKTSSSKRKKDDDDYVPSSSSNSEDSDNYDIHDHYDSRDVDPQIQQENNGDLDEDRALEQAIALSLRTPADNVTDCTRSRVPRTQKNKRRVSEKKGTAMKRRKGVQEEFTLEEIATIFAIIDERGNGKFSIADLERVVRSHDFTWSKQEIADMINIFDINKDGQLDLPEFQSIFGRMNMLKMHVT